MKYRSLVFLISVFLMGVFLCIWGTIGKPTAPVSEAAEIPAYSADGNADSEQTPAASPVPEVESRDAALVDTGAGVISFDNLRGAVSCANQFPAENVTMTLLKDCTLYETICFEERSGTLVFDLNGNTLSRKNENAQSDGALFTFSHPGTVTIANGTLTACRNRGNGGAICLSNDEADVTLEKLTITDAAATGFGGAIYMDGGSESLTLDTCIITGNTAEEFGGGVYIGYQKGKTPTLTVRGETVIKDNGGAKGRNNLILCKNGSQFVKPDFGGLREGAEIYLAFQTFEADTLLTDCGTLKDAAEYLFCDTGYMKLEQEGENLRFSDTGNELAAVTKNDTRFFYDNISQAWSDANLWNDSAVTVKLFADWTAKNGSFGSGIGFENGRMVVQNRGEGEEISENTLTLDLNGHTINRNLSEGTKDGGIFDVDESCCFRVVSTAEKAGTVTGANNTDSGGAFRVYGDETRLIVSNIRISGNTTRGYGAAVYTENSDVQVELYNVNVSNNTSACGGAVYLCADPDAQINMNGVVTVKNNWGNTEYANFLIADGRTEMAGRGAMPDTFCRNLANGSEIHVNMIEKMCVYLVRYTDSAIMTRYSGCFATDSAKKYVSVGVDTVTMQCLH